MSMRLNAPCIVSFPEMKRKPPPEQAGIPCSRINNRNFLPPDDRNSVIRLQARSAYHDGERPSVRKKRPRLSRLLQSLIEDAGLNKLDSLTNPRIRANYRECPDAIRQVTLQQEYIRGRALSEIIQPELKNTVVRSPESNGTTESLVKTIKRDYISIMPKPDGLTAAKNLAGAFGNDNEWHPHSVMGYRSPREYLRQRTSNELSDNRCLEIQGKIHRKTFILLSCYVLKTHVTICVARKLFLNYCLVI